MSVCQYCITTSVSVLMTYGVFSWLDVPCKPCGNLGGIWAQTNCKSNFLFLSSFCANPQWWKFNPKAHITSDLHSVPTLSLFFILSINRIFRNLGQTHLFISPPFCLWCIFEDFTQWMDFRAFWAVLVLWQQLVKIFSNQDQQQLN